MINSIIRTSFAVVLFGFVFLSRNVVLADDALVSRIKSSMELSSYAIESKWTHSDGITRIWNWKDRFDRKRLKSQTKQGLVDSIYNGEISTEFSPRTGKGPANQILIYPGKDKIDFERLQNPILFLNYGLSISLDKRSIEERSSTKLHSENGRKILTFQTGKTGHKVETDPNYSDAVLSYEYKFENGWIGLEKRSDFRLVNGHWVAFKGEIFGNGKVTTSYDIVQAKVNDEIDPSVFDIIIPPKTVVSDNRFHVTYISGAGTTREKQLAELADAAMAEQGQPPRKEKNRNAYIVLTSIVILVFVSLAVVYLVRRKFLGLLVCFLFAIHSGKIEAQLESNPFGLDTYTSCGPNCVTFINNMLTNRIVDYNRVCELCEVGPQGTSLKNLEKACNELGLSPNVVQFKSTGISRLSLPCIMGVRLEKRGTNHYVVLVRKNAEGNSFYVFNPPGSLEWIDLKTLKEITSGLAVQVYVSNSRQIDSYRIEKTVGIFLAVSGILLLLGHRLFQNLRNRVFGRLAVVSFFGLATLLGCNGRVTSSKKATNEHVKKLGELSPGQVVSASFELRNESTKSIKITKIVRSCVCLDVGLDVELGQSIAPQSTLSIPVKFTASETHGFARKSVDLITDSLEHNYASIRLTIEGMVVAPVIIDPVKLVFGKVKSEGDGIRKITIGINDTALNEKEFDLVSNDSRILIEKLSNSPQIRTFNAIVNRNFPRGDITGELQVVCESEIIKKIHFMGFIDRELSSTPSSLIISGVNRRTAFRIEGTGARQVSVKSCTSTLDGLQFAVAKKSELEYFVDIELDATNARVGKGLVQVDFEGSDQELLIPISVSDGY